MNRSEPLRLERGSGNGERGTGNEERGTGNGERGTKNLEQGTGNGKRTNGESLKRFQIQKFAICIGWTLKSPNHCPNCF